MTSKNFNQFCKFLSDDLILNSYSAYGVMVDFKRLLKDIKSDILIELQSGNRDKTLYLGYLINEIDKTDYPKEEDKVSVKIWLEKYEISLESIFNQNFFNTQFFKVFEVDTYVQDNPIHYSDVHDEPYYRDARKLQHDFLYYFRWYFTNELLNFIYSLKEDFKSENSTKQIDTGFETNYLDEFCKKVQDTKALDSSSFLQCYEYGILAYTDSLKEEIYRNLTKLPKDKVTFYLKLVETRISNTLFYDTQADSLDIHLLSFNLKDESFPFKQNKKVRHFISSNYNRIDLDDWQRETMYDIQHAFFEYASMIEAKKITSLVKEEYKKFKDEKENVSDKHAMNDKIKWNGKVSQLCIIMAELVETDFIEPPKRKNNEINYEQFARLIKSHFEVEGTEGTISKYLNIRSEKGQETLRKFKDRDFNIPHKSIMS